MKGKQMRYTDHFSTDELRVKRALYERVLLETNDDKTKRACADGIAVITRALVKRGAK